MFGLTPGPRRGWTTIETAEERDTANPDCTVCPREWIRRRLEDATTLLRDGIRRGQFGPEIPPDARPDRVWVRDPEDLSIVYEAKRLTHPENGYKAYPITRRQVRSLPLSVD